MSKKIDPYCKKYPGAFIEFNGLITPCCWLVTDKTRYNLLQDFLGSDFEKVFITNPPEEIIKAYKKIEDSWETDSPFATCKHVCSMQDPDSAVHRNSET